VHLEDRYPFYRPDSWRGWLTGSEILDTWIAEHQRELLGHVAVVRLDEDPQNALRWRELTGLSVDELAGVSRFFVRRRVRGTGVGGLLLDQAVQAIRDRGLHPVLDVVTQDRAAVELYESRGWRLLASYPWGRSEDRLRVHYYRAA
jgi:GNAT superfamily N-acetyltransferase